jgi:two-component system sensor kinase FixL
MAKAGQRRRGGLPETGDAPPHGQSARVRTPRADPVATKPDELLFRTLAETTAAITFIHRDDRVLYVNRAATKVTGYSRKELLAGSFWNLIHPSMRKEARAQGRVRLLGGSVPTRSEVEIVTRSGESRWVEFTAASILYEGEAAVLGTAFDITDRKRAHAALRKSEKRFRALIEHSSDLVTLTAADGTILYVSPNVRRILGYDPRVLVGRNALDLVHPHDVDALSGALVDLLAHPGAPATALYRCRHEDGTWRWMEAVGTNVVGEFEDGAVIVNKRDVTDRHRAEEEARQRRTELARVLRRGAVGEMAAGVAHEINQPLAAIVNYARGTLRRLERGGSGGDVRQPLRKIAAQAIRAGEIVHDLKRFVRKEPPRYEPVDLNALVTNVVRLVQNEARHCGVELRRLLAEGLEPLHGDRVQLEQVIFNLVRNGIEAIGRTGMPGTLSMRTAQSGDEIELTVTDTGDGIAAGDRQRVFEPFFSTKSDGLGMGLSITRTIVEAHGGRIWTEAARGGGAVFRVALPLRREDDPAP